jgi:hypothetical protein
MIFLFYFFIFYGSVYNQRLYDKAQNVTLCFYSLIVLQYKILLFIRKLS